MILMKSFRLPRVLSDKNALLTHQIPLLFFVHRRFQALRQLPQQPSEYHGVEGLAALYDGLTATDQRVRPIHKRKYDLTQEQLQEVLAYDPATGLFTRRRTGRVTGTISNFGYVLIRVRKQLWVAHRLAWLYCYGRHPKEDLDHIKRQIRAHTRRRRDAKDLVTVPP